ncbi:hypothetical protein PO878_04110 [Iamia majanohamensis]|uniref:Uncharacterized protein n=1 Tax=Iamia majanohamensis TaxID=467976 RepID=A0AAE9YG49_9ACTN|nr:hypothetical protein [Iamia majanohamensis]WCO67907.1 hypothetical protein PO878_04110 [Iamia majanohamensis]
MSGEPGPSYCERTTDDGTVLIAEAQGWSAWDAQRCIVSGAARSTFDAMEQADFWSRPVEREQADQ